ncbi:tetratricopeptide repeat protein [Thiolinea disciformis]|uniref:tetratricopeptide repeat protein n=1 Tax=Thiolinea disciformis TaxID=125614 RepID=UPI00037A77E4|nr:tetratricopeptide repeat protein [Thiolinea disciformis]
MKITVKSLPYTLLSMLTLGLAACAPMTPEPVYEPQYGQPQPQALPHYNQPPIIMDAQPLPRPSQQQQQAPYQAPRQQQTMPPPEQRADTTKRAQPSWMTAPYPDPNSKTAKTPKAETKPFWDEGKVQVEVLDIKKDAGTNNASTDNNGTVTTSVTPLQRPSSGDAVSKSTSTSTSTTISASSTPSISSSSFGSSNPAVAVLMRQANNELAAGNTGRAASTLERALRITPDDANLWLRLAEVHQQQGDKRQAASMAEKALTLAPDDPSVRQRSQRFLP